MSKTVLLSGGFDPLHRGHLRMIQAAMNYGDVIVALNSDEWLMKKKGFVFMEWQERKEILEAIAGVHSVVRVIDADDTVCNTIEALCPDYFANGGDRLQSNTPELAVCHRIGCEPLFGIGGSKVNSSSSVARRNRVQRDWGSYEVMAEGNNYKIKLLHIAPGGETSLQSHQYRSELWQLLTGEVIAKVRQNSYLKNKAGEEIFVPQCAIHQLRNESDKPASVLETQLGTYLGEDDIQRYG